MCSWLMLSLASGGGLCSARCAVTRAEVAEAQKAVGEGEGGEVVAT
jgi:hypothetical protein